ncbi:MAG: ABC transporter permease subunit [Rubrivivax sp.]|nr:ABC transporter permease subunit [Rubrivivax sp.]
MEQGRHPLRTADPVRPPPKPRRRFSLRSRAVRGWLYQALALALIAFGVWFLAHNTLENMRVRGIQSGFDFLTQPAGFDIGERPVPYESSDGYWRAFAVGLANTLRVAIIGIVLTTVIGTLLGIGRFSPNALVRGLCYVYVEAFRNIPVLLQLLMGYLLLTEVLPDPGEPLTLGGVVYLSKGGLSLPWPDWSAGGLLPAWQLPQRGDVAVTGGAELTPEFLAVLGGLTLYTAAFVAEVVRAGIASVPQGQVEAARALGLPRGRQLRLVVLPQALRVIIPPLTNQYLNLTKNSSLAVAIGYPDVVSIANTSLNQTGRAVECIAIIMAVYLFTSLGTSGFMNWYNARAAIRER